MKLLLHIGTEKTGTTSAQKWAAANREALTRQGVFYSRVLGDSNHRKIYLWALPPDTDDEGWGAIGIPAPQQRAQFQAALPDILAKEIAQARALGCHTYLISNEHCHSRLRSADNIRRLHALLSPHFDDIEILCSLRPQIDVAVSLASTLTRGYLPVTRAMFSRVKAKTYYYDYESLHENWAGVFGAQALTYVPFRTRPDLAAYLVETLALDPTPLAPAQRFNEAVDVRVMALVNAMNLPRRHDVQGTFLSLPFADLPCEQKLQPGIEIARRVQKRFMHSNARLAALRQDIRAEDLEPDFSRYDAPSNLPMLDRDCAFSEQMNTIIAVGNQRTTLAQVALKLTEADAALTRQNLPDATMLLTQAQAQLAPLAAQPRFGDRIQRLEARLTSLQRRIQAH